MLIAQGKAAEAAALGKPPPHPISLLPIWFGAPQRTKPDWNKQRESFCVP
jgi:hypothetical protein